MWIAFRLILAIIGFAIRQLSRGKQHATDGVFEGIGYFEKVLKNKRRPVGFVIGMERRSPTWLRCHAESSADRFFKWLGVANEVQTGDASFDDLVYVTCDHPYIHALLIEAPELRAAIRAAFEEGYKRVMFNGATVAIEREADHEPLQRDFELLKRIHTASARLEDEVPSRLGDLFLWKALLVESLIWGVGGYAIGAAIELFVLDADVHVAHRQLIGVGLTLAVAAFVVLIALIVLSMRGSSRGHRVIVESALVLLIGLPSAAIQIVGDTNRALDDAPPTVVTRTASQCEVREHRRRRNRRTYSYHLWIQPAPEQSPSVLPRSIEITRELCTAVAPGASVELTIGPGRWDLAWYRQIRVGETMWIAP
ncbi:MAG: hypothetical protein H0T42_04970 [Deltaproteobacteria bacterium]|nr:hypothetical protein [Deltaproteobacteria bacterium]